MVDRPIECSDCRKALCYRFSEVVDGKITETVHCRECPVLQAKMMGRGTKRADTASGKVTALTCGTCGTTIEEVRRGNPLGCAACYEVFADVLAFELIQAGDVSRMLNNPTPKSPTLHMGRRPGELIEVTPAMKLVALTEALGASLKGEDYEQAAWLRDQIKRLEEGKA